MTPDRETLAAALHVEYHDADEFGCSFGFDCYGLEWARKAADHLLAGPLAPPSPPEGEADEAAGRVATALDALALGVRADVLFSAPSVPNAGPLLISDLRLLLADRELWRSRAFRAYRMAMEPEEGAEVQWGIQYPGDSTVSWTGTEADARALTHDEPGSVRCRTVGPWKPK